jgi:hypothetical protein
MLAIEISRHGGPGALRLVERSDPVPSADELLVRNRWIGVNYVDLQHREGRPYPVELPLVPGIDAAAWSAPPKQSCGRNRPVLSEDVQGRSAGVGGRRARSRVKAGVV